MKFFKKREKKLSYVACQHTTDTYIRKLKKLFKKTKKKPYVSKLYWLFKAEEKKFSLKCKRRITEVKKQEKKIF